MSDNSTKKSDWKRKYRLFKQQEDRQEFEGWEVDDFIKHIFELRQEVTELQDQLDNIKILPKQEGEPEQQERRLKTEDFKQDWPYSTKFVFLLTMEDKPLTSREIHDHLLKLDKQYQFYTDPKATLSVYLRAVVKSGRINSVKLPGIKEKLFAMPEWVDREGQIKIDYRRLLQPFKF
ncbi:MAG: hypothetical protein HY062_15580 [Bacteroidetes bacterium]|nr:hypothetical protein [Bacteroidota bacterium]